MSRKPRHPTDEELELWRYVTRQVTRRFSSVDHAPPRQPAIEKVEPPATSKPRPLPPSSLANAPAPHPRAGLPPLVLGAKDGIDRGTARRFARGELNVDGRLDLHGQTLAEAQASVSAFIRRGAQEGRRFVIIVTGKGSGGRGGKIRAEAMHWLGAQPLRGLIIAVREAPPQHGGSGALYVLLKRRRDE